MKIRRFKLSNHCLLSSFSLQVEIDELNFRLPRMKSLLLCALFDVAVDYGGSIDGVDECVIVCQPLDEPNTAASLCNYHSLSRRSHRSVMQREGFVAVDTIIFF